MCLAAEAIVIYCAALKVSSGLINFSVPANSRNHPKNLSALEQKQPFQSYLKGEGAPVNTHHVKLCVYSTFVNTHHCSVYGLDQSVCLWSALFTGMPSWNILFSFLKEESLRTCWLRKVTQKEVVCLHCRTVFECRYVNLVRVAINNKLLSEKKRRHRLKKRSKDLSFRH